MHQSRLRLLQRLEVVHEVVCHVGSWPKTRTSLPAPHHEIPMLVLNCFWPWFHCMKILCAVICDILDSGLTPGLATGDDLLEV